MNISGKWKIRTKVNETTGKISYRTTITTKDIEGNTEYYTIFLSLVGDAKFKGIDDNSFIIVKPENAWLSFYRKSETETQIVAIVKDFEYENEQEDSLDRAFNNQTSGDDLPF